MPENWGNAPPGGVGGAPRVLKLTFEFRIAPGLRADVRAKRIRSAVERLTAAVQALASTAFPWADSMSVTKEWAYLWMAGTEQIKLPATEENTRQAAHTVHHPTKADPRARTEFPS